jgi:hypothetical protein
MAHDEMNTIGSLGSAPSTVQATCERERTRTYACFAAKDEWVGQEVESVRRMLDESRVVVRDDDVPHAFCISECCLSWVLCLCLTITRRS